MLSSRTVLVYLVFRHSFFLRLLDDVPARATGDFMFFILRAHAVCIHLRGHGLMPRLPVGILLGNRIRIGVEFHHMHAFVSQDVLGSLLWNLRSIVGSQDETIRKRKAHPSRALSSGVVRVAIFLADLFLPAEGSPFESLVLPHITVRLLQREQKSRSAVASPAVHASRHVRNR